VVRTARVVVVCSWAGRVGVGIMGLLLRERCRVAVVYWLLAGSVAGAGLGLTSQVLGPGRL
jgi:hypothetical protein